MHPRTARKEYIVAKYAERRYILPKEHSEVYHVYDTVRSKDLTSLLQLYAEGEDLSKPVATPDGQVRPLNPTIHTYTASTVITKSSGLETLLRCFELSEMSAFRNVHLSLPVIKLNRCSFLNQFELYKQKQDICVVRCH